MPLLNTPDIITQGIIQPPSQAPLPPPRLFPSTKISPAVDSHNNPPKEVIITNEKSLTEHRYSKIKSTAEQDMKLMITTSTERSKEDIGKVINNAKSTALIDINAKYNAILADLKKYDTPKEDLENESEIAIKAINNFKLTGKHIQDKILSLQNIRKLNKIL